MMGTPLVIGAMHFEVDALDFHPIIQPVMSLRTWDCELKRILMGVFQWDWRWGSSRLPRVMRSSTKRSSHGIARARPSLLS